MLVVVIYKFCDTPPIKRWNLIMLPLPSQIWAYGLASWEKNEAKSLYMISKTMSLKGIPVWLSFLGHMPLNSELPRKKSGYLEASIL